MNEIDTLETLRFSHLVTSRTDAHYNKAFYAIVDPESGTIFYEVYSFGDMIILTKSTQKAVDKYNRIRRRPRQG